MQATQNFSRGVILDAESDGNEIFWKFENFTILQNNVRVQPIPVIKLGLPQNIRFEIMILVGGSSINGGEYPWLVLSSWFYKRLIRIIQTLN